MAMRSPAAMRYHLLFALIALASFLIAGDRENTSPSPVQQRIAAAQKRIQTDPKSWQSYNDLAFALCRWARDNGDVKLYEQAESALQHSLQLSPRNYDAKKLQVTVLLGEHEFTQALSLATELNNRAHDDIGVWGLLVDAHLAIGNYDKAETAAQWILDLRRDSSLGFEKAAFVRERFGDVEGAIEFLEEASRRTAPSDADQRAWLLTQNARLQLAAGNLSQAQQLLNEAIKLFPDSQLARDTVAKLRRAQGDYADARASKQ